MAPAMGAIDNPGMKMPKLPHLALLLCLSLSACASPDDSASSGAGKDSPSAERIAPRQLFATSRDGTRIAVYEQGRPAAQAPTVVLVHGYPDTAALWDGVAAELEARYHVLRYDTRGSGASDHPAGARPYRLPLLADDFQAVIDLAAPGKPVHLVGHDWGGVQSWEPAARADLAPRIASLTIISGPSIDLTGQELRNSRGRSAAEWAGLMEQLASSSYIAVFHLPLLPELAWYGGAAEPAIGALQAFEGAERRPGYQPSDGAHAVNLYRANIVPRALAPTYDYVDVPLVQLIIPLRDRYVRPQVWMHYEDAVPLLWKRSIDAGHWVPESEPEFVAAGIAEAIEYRERGTPPSAEVEVLP